MDVVMGADEDGIRAAQQIKQLSPETKIVIVTSMPEVTFIKRAREAGIESFWHKEIQEQPILEIMRRTMAEESVYPLKQPQYSVIVRRTGLYRNMISCSRRGCLRPSVQVCRIKGVRKTGAGAEPVPVLFILNISQGSVRCFS